MDPCVQDDKAHFGFDAKVFGYVYRQNGFPFLVVLWQPPVKITATWNFPQLISSNNCRAAPESWNLHEANA